MGGGHADLDAELIPLVSFALAEALDCRCLPTVPLVSTFLFRCQQPPGHRQFVCKHRLQIRSPSGFLFHVPDYPAPIRPQTPERAVPAAALPGMGNPVRSQPRRRALTSIVLAPSHPMRSAQLHQSHPGTVPPLGPVPSCPPPPAATPAASPCHSPGQRQSLLSGPARHRKPRCAGGTASGGGGRSAEEAGNTPRRNSTARMDSPPNGRPLPRPTVCASA